MILVDTNVLVDVFQNDAEWADWSIAQLRTQARIHELAINAVVYAELSAAFERYEELDRAVSGLGLVLLEIPRPALFLAGKAFVRYRRAGGSKSKVLPDFLIGAHAAVEKMPVLTRDVRPYRRWFPGVTLVSPPMG